jgi:hypothetical protein
MYRLGLAALTLACALCAPLSAPAHISARPERAEATSRLACGSGFVDGVVGGQHKCLHTGEFCSARREPDYRRYGFTCGGGRLRRSGSAPASSPAPHVKQVPGRTRALLRRTKSHGCRVRGPLPDRRCSPGAVYTDATVALICTPGYSTKVRDVPESEKAAVYSEYGIPRQHYGRPYEVDHIVSLELGGSNAIANLYPEAAFDPSPGFHVKDRLENRLHALVCEGRMGLGAVQRSIASNWVALYRRVFGIEP